MSTAPAPPWVESWCATPFDLTPAGIATILALGQSEAGRAAVTRFPPGTVVRCTCDEPGCALFGIVVDIWVQSAERAALASWIVDAPRAGAARPQVTLGLASAPERGSRRSMVCHERVEPIGYAGAWTPATVQLLLDGVEAGG